MRIRRTEVRARGETLVTVGGNDGGEREVPIGNGNAGTERASAGLKPGA